MSKRDHIPISTKRALLEETVYRCASCLCSIEHCDDDDNFFKFDEKAHITPHSKTQDDSFENLITLCPTCHTKYDKMKNKTESLERVRNLKRQWLNASGKYSKIELDCLFDLYQCHITGKNNTMYLEERELTTSDGRKFKVFVQLLPIRQTFLFRNIINNKLVNKTAILEAPLKHSAKGILVVSGGGDGRNPTPNEDSLCLYININGIEFCKKMFNL